MSTPDWLTRARDLHRRVLVIDGHADTLDRAVTEGLDFARGAAELHLDWPRLSAAGINAQALAIWTPPDRHREAAMARAMQLVATLRVGMREVGVRQILGVEDLDAGRPGVLLTMEDAAPLIDDPLNLEVFHALGVRMIGLTWNGRNAFADGQKVGPTPGGLTDLGRALVARMDALGVVVDLAHIAEPGFWDALAVATRPVAVSHANARALHDHHRNLTDEQLKAIAATGGLVGVTFVPGFLTSGAAAREHVVAHLEHMLGVIGEEHVALGSDFDGITAGPAGLGDVSALTSLTADLLERGHTEARVEKILGSNWERVFRAVWK